MADDKTAALVVALSAQLTRFEKDMNRAVEVGDRAASSIEKRFADLNPFAGTFLGNFAANFANKAFDSAIDFVKDLTRRFIELDATAKLVGVSMNEIFGVQQAAAKAKVPIDDVTASVKSLAVLLDQLQRGEKNSLAELFAANPQALKDVNLETLTLQQALAIVADLVRNARTEIQKIDLAKAAGQTETMVKFLEQGGQAVTYLSRNAAATAPDLQKLADTAKAFDDAWKQAVQNVKAYLSENFFEIIKQDLSDIVALLGLAVRFLGLFKGGPIELQTARAAEEIRVLRDRLVAFKAARDQIDESAGLDTSASARNDRRLASPNEPRQTGTSTRDPNAALSNVPLKPQAREPQDSFDRTEEAITRHTATIRADTIAVSQNNAVQAQLRAEFQLLNAIRKDDGEVTQEQIDVYTKLRETMSAELALEQAKINLSPAHKQSFIDASEGAKVATAAYDDARKKVSDLNNASQQAGQALSTAFADAVIEGKNLQEVLNSLLKTLLRFGINSVFGSFFNAPASGGLSPFAGLVSGIGNNAEGTDNWRGGLTWVGERGKELVNLPKGSQIIPQSRVGGTTFAPVYQIDASGADSGTVARLYAVLEQHSRAIAGQARAAVSAQRMQSSGVS